VQTERPVNPGRFGMAGKAEEVDDGVAGDNVNG
jgi:hypothetical protein